MTSGRRTPTAAKRAMLLAGAALAAVLAQTPAHAALGGSGHQKPALAQQPAVKKEPPQADGLADDELYMEADLLTRDDKNQHTTAEGNVEIRYQGRTLRADRVTYDEGAEGQ